MHREYELSEDEIEAEVLARHDLNRITPNRPLRVKAALVALIKEIPGLTHPNSFGMHALLSVYGLRS